LGGNMGRGKRGDEKKKPMMVRAHEPLGNKRS